ncbi:ATP synthase subunit d, mitochondrial-like [Epargyreus clarus]|uniref:ATP synthase subunit d, mitochondrial-like n=1 Tax=Epargyreus clarus TaxID=520877 RepID=UPI003C2DE8BA
MAKRFTKPTINWVEMEKRVPPSQKANFFAFKAKADAYYRRVQASPAEAPKINWEEYSKIVPVPGLVEKFKTAYAAFKVPYPADTLSAKIDEQWKALQPEIQKFCETMQKEIDAVTVDLNKVKALPKFDDMTMEMFAELYPNEALDFTKKPSFWPHNIEEQPGYMTPEQKAMKAAGHH